MKNDYETYIKEIWEIKEKAYNDFKKSKYNTYIEYIKKEIDSEKINFKFFK